MKSALAEASITMPVTEARAKVAEYLKSVRERHNAEDYAILQGYKALAKGHTVIDLAQVIRLGGIFEDGPTAGLPRLAIATSSHAWVWVERNDNGKVTFLPGIRSSWASHEHSISHQRRKDCFFLPSGTLPQPTVRSRNGGWYDDPYNGAFRAMVPHVPPGLRPRHSLDGYATLFEVEEWAKSPAPPRDPALLKHIGGDLYAVLATWDLTELERSVLGGRLH